MKKQETERKIMKRNILLIILASVGMIQQQACLAQALLRGKIVNGRGIDSQDQTFS